MKIQAPPGMRDFYPADMRLQNWLFDAWRRVSRSFGFSEYDGPIFEFLDLFTIKSGDEIVSQLFDLEDRGGRRFAIRPEMTPTLARMVAARANSLPKPIKWFSIPRLCRAEKPQRGRLREFYQWNADILGVDDVLADAEIIAVAVAFLREVGLTHEDAVVKLSSRPIATAALASIGIDASQADRAFQLIDRYDKLGPNEFRRQWNEAYGPDVPSERLERYLTEASLEQCLDLVAAAGEQGVAARTQFESLLAHLESFGVMPFCKFDLRVVRGLGYYTGPVFEVFGRRSELRAVLGGGRYDDLTTMLDGPRVPGVGFGMGDAPMMELLKELGKLPELAEKLDIFIIDADPQLFATVQEFAAALRGHGLATDFSYKRVGVAKQFKQASSRGAQYALVVGSEYVERRELTVKNLERGQQITVPADDLLRAPQDVLRRV